MPGRGSFKSATETNLLSWHSEGREGPNMPLQRRHEWDGGMKWDDGMLEDSRFTCILVVVVAGSMIRERQSRKRGGRRRQSGIFIGHTPSCSSCCLFFRRAYRYALNPIGKASSSGKPPG